MKKLLNSLNLSLEQIISIIEVLNSLPTTQHNLLYCELNIGKHIRHMNDHYFAVKRGMQTGVINYNYRNRGAKVESSSQAAYEQLHLLLDWIVELNTKSINDISLKEIKIFSEIDNLQTISLDFQSTIGRELLYLLNHSIHHAAHIALICKNENIEIPANTGIAPCTMSFLRASNS